MICCILGSVSQVGRFIFGNKIADITYVKVLHAVFQQTSTVKLEYAKIQNL